MNPNTTGTKLKITRKLEIRVVTQTIIHQSGDWRLEIDSDTEQNSGDWRLEIDVDTEQNSGDWRLEIAISCFGNGAK